VVQHDTPRNEIEAQFSLPHAVAAAMLSDTVLPESFSSGNIEHEAFRAFRSKVRKQVRQEWGWSPTGWTPRITYRLRDGRVIVRQPEHSRGQPPELFSFDDCIAKYRGCVEARISEQAIVGSIELVRRLEDCRDLSSLVQMVAGPPRAS
jgi:2-methylcitrate dehydratase